MQDKHQASHSQEKLAKAGHLPPRGDGVRSSFLCCSPGCTSEVTLPVQFSFIFLALSNQCHPFPRWLGTAEGAIVHAAGESSERLLDTRARCWHLRCLFPLMSLPSSHTGPHRTSHRICQGLQWPSEHEEPRSDIPVVPGSTGTSSSRNASCIEHCWKANPQGKATLGSCSVP